MRERALPTSQALTPSERALVEHEEALLVRVRHAIADAALRQRTPETARERFLALREDVGEANADDLPAIVTQMELIKQQAAVGASEPLPDLRVPYFARMRLRSQGRVRDVLLGHHTFLDSRSGLHIVDWRKAPIARVFFRHRQGEDYELELPTGHRTGVVEARTVLTFAEGVLARIDHADGTLRRGDDGQWHSGTDVWQPLLAGARGGPRARQLASGAAGVRPVVTALLDPEQCAAMESADDGALLLLGAAGCGKTTVALHRLAVLHARNPDRYPHEAMAVVVPSPGLERLTRLLLRELRMHQVEVCTFDDWVRRRARAVFKRLPARECEEPSSRVVRFKRHPAMLRAIVELAERQGVEELVALEQQLGATPGEVVEHFALVSGKTLQARFDKLERWWTRGWPADAKQAARRLFNRARRRLVASRDDLLALLGDESLLQLAVDASGGALGPDDLEEVVRHTRIQFSESADERYAGIDKERLQALDGLSLDAGTPDEDIGTIDVEDYALLLELQRLKVGAGGKHRSWAHLVVDEAQDLAAIELAALGGALRHDASVTVAGDAAQHIDPAACFTSWRDVLRELGVEQTQTVCLETNYRCPRPVAEFGHAILGPLAPVSPPRAIRDGEPVARSAAVDLAHAALQVVETLTELLDREPAANVAVIARDGASATYFYEMACQSLDAELVLDGNFQFGPGVEVTEIAAVKGLEFDYVVLPDVAASDWSDLDAARRALHVAVTRAIHQLWVVTIGPPPAFMPAVAQP